uniref:Cytochrome c oxidase polypeptide VIa n=1 Tax=Phocoena sinus TaxID=42100 RepID=A0A8C9BTM2_PHOSS
AHTPIVLSSSLDPVSGPLGRSRLPLSRPMSSGAHSEQGSARMWKALTCLVALPRSRHGEEDRPEAVDYPRLRIRSKPFPWEDGNHILVHNPRVNLLPTGYEDE